MKLKRKKIWRLTTAARNSMKIPFTHFQLPPGFSNSTTFNSIIWFPFVVSFVRLLIVSTTLWSVFLFSRQLSETPPSNFLLLSIYHESFQYCFPIADFHNLLSHDEFVVIHSGRLLHSLFSFSSLRCFIVGLFFSEKGNYWLKLFLRDETWNCRQKREAIYHFGKLRKA